MFDFDLTEVEAASGGVIPKGKYLSQVEKVELKDSKSGGQYLNVQFNVTDEQQNGRKFFELYNINNKSEEAVKIALGQIKALVVASGANLNKFTDPQQLVGLECLISLKVQTDDEYGDKNKITSYSALKTDATPFQQEIPKGTDGKPVF